MQGVIAAVPTPVEADGAPIEALFVGHCCWALDHGCDGLNILGSTGEANSFDAATRCQVMGWAVAACPKDNLMVGTGTPLRSGPREAPPADLVSRVTKQRKLMAGPDLIPGNRALVAQRTDDDHWSNILSPFLSHGTADKIAQQVWTV